MVKDYTIEEKETIIKDTIDKMKSKIEDYTLIIYSLENQLKLLSFEKIIKKEKETRE